jgi:hypothetical protein
MLSENRDILEKSSSRFSLIRALDASPQDLQTSDLNYTVSAGWMGYFVDDPNSRAARKSCSQFIELGIDSLWLAIPRTYSRTPAKGAKSLKAKARRTENRAAPAMAGANPKDSLRKRAALSTNSTRLARFKGTAIFSNGYIQHWIVML